MAMKLFEYSKCSTCRKAKKWLDAKGIDYDAIDIVTKPPSRAVLAKILKGDRYQLKHLFNTSGQLYRSMELKNKLPSMSQDEALDLLAANGKLIKRPIASSGGQFTVGFKEAVFEDVWG